MLCDLMDFVMIAAEVPHGFGISDPAKHFPRLTKKL
jgi:hypothetical protein